VPLEASGGINLQNVRAYAEAGVDYISVGALTHSPAAVDMSLRVMPASPESTVRGSTRMRADQTS
jgi:nicotinate-nucleotide pyrophosphorylase